MNTLAKLACVLAPMAASATPNPPYDLYPYLADGTDNPPLNYTKVCETVSEQGDGMSVGVR